ncbi:MAG: hypothetical protein LRY54_01250 [Alphaproteobacteria bacterium]|nr:hypothetical protein [Alphaproteobacteria bacterium]
MKNPLARLSGLSGYFRKRSEDNDLSSPVLEDKQPSLPDAAIFAFKDDAQPAIFLGVLSLLIPTQQMADTAFDDYHPTLFIGLQCWGENRAGISAAYRSGSQDPVFRNTAQNIIDQYRALIEELDQYAPAWDQNGRKIRDLDAENYMRTVYENLDLLGALKAALETPIEKLPFIRQLALARPDQPLKADLAFNTRFGKAYHTEYLEDFLRFIDWTQERALQLDLDVPPSLSLNSPAPGIPDRDLII